MKPHIRSFKFLNPRHPRDRILTIGIILNQLESNHNYFSQILPHSDRIVCADGGANIYFNHLKKNKNSMLPSVIIGDFDSISPRSIKFFTQKNVSLIKNNDQNSNDYEKVIAHTLSDSPFQQNDQKVRFFSNNSFKRFDHYL